MYLYASRSLSNRNAFIFIPIWTSRWLGIMEKKLWDSCTWCLYPVVPHLIDHMISVLYCLSCISPQDPSSRKAADPSESSDSEKPLLIAHYLYIQVCDPWPLTPDPCGPIVDLSCCVSSDGVLWEKHAARHDRSGLVSGHQSPLEALQGDPGRSVLHPWAGEHHHHQQHTASASPFIYLFI